MTVLRVIQDAAPKLGFAVPSVVFSETTRTAVELQEAVNEAAQGVIDDYDWQGLKKFGSVTGDGSATDFAMPADFARMLKKGKIYPSDEPTLPIALLTDADEWLELDVQAVQTVSRRAIILENRLHIKPALPNLTTAQFAYVKNLIVVADGGTSPTKTAFDADSDSFALDERVLKLSLIWRWKAAKGRPYAEDRLAYDAVVDTKAGSDKGSRILHVGKPRHSTDARISYPWPLGQ